MLDQFLQSPYRNIFRNELRQVKLESSLAPDEHYRLTKL